MEEPTRRNVKDYKSFVESGAEDLNEAAFDGGKATHLMGSQGGTLAFIWVGVDGDDVEDSTVYLCTKCIDADEAYELVYMEMGIDPEEERIGFTGKVLRIEDQQTSMIYQVESKTGV